MKINQAAKLLGSIKSEKKAKASRENALKASKAAAEKRKNLSTRKSNDGIVIPNDKV